MRRMFACMMLMMMLLMLTVWVQIGQTAQVTLGWDPVDFAVCGSDPALSGVNLYKAADENADKTKIGTVDTTTTTFTYTETENAKFCYFATAFNQAGESDYSIPACAYITDTKPAKPTGFKAWVAQVVAAWKAWVNKGKG